MTFLVALLFSPLVLWHLGYNTLAAVLLIFVILSLPSMIKVVYLAVKHREWPRIVGGPGITWAGWPANRREQK